MQYRPTTPDDAPLLAKLNRQLILDEGHRNRMTLPELEARLRGWLAGEYAAIVFEDAGAVVGYALYREEPDEVYLRQLMVVRERRREGFGRKALDILRQRIWPDDKRLTVEALVGNPPAVAFFRACGYRDYCLTLEIKPGNPAID